MVRHKDQHWVPRSYLEAWVDRDTPIDYDGFVHVFDRTGSRHKRKSPKKILSMPDLYTIFDGHDRDLSIEKTFSRWEDAFIRTRRKIENGARLVDEDIANLYVFAGALMVRPPHHIEYMASQWRNIVDKARSIRINPNVKPLPTLLSEGPSLSLNEAQQFADDPMGTWFRDDVSTTIEVLAERFGIEVLVNRSEHAFLTSDAPAVTCHPPRDSRYRSMPRGLGSPGCEVTLPISPDYALLFRLGPSGLYGFIEADWEAVFDINFRTITRAREKIVSSREDLFFVKAILDKVAEVDGSHAT